MKKVSIFFVTILISLILSACSYDADGTSETTLETADVTTAVQEPVTEETETEAVTSLSDEELASEMGKGGEASEQPEASVEEDAEVDSSESISLDAIPEYSGEPYVTVNDNQPEFSDADKKNTDAFEFYSDLDSLGRCGQAYANICPELEPTEERGAIGSIKPSGWHTVKYNDLIDGNYLYNRCHLIGYQLAGENANEKNLITGTRYLNVEGMLPFEDEVDDYVDETGNHVLYRVTPIFDGDNLVASGVQMEGWSVEDDGSGVCFNVYCYNVQPGIGIDYASGESWVDGGTQSADGVPSQDGVQSADKTTPQTDTQSAVDTSSKGEDSVAENIDSQTGSGEVVVIPDTQDTNEQSIQEQSTESDDDTVNDDFIANKNTKKFHIPGCSSVNDMADKNKVYYSDTTVEEMKALGYSPCKRCLD